MQVRSSHPRGGCSTSSNLIIFGNMGHEKVTSKETASEAGRTLGDPDATERERSLAGSALSQSRGKHRKKKQKSRPRKKRSK